MGLEDWGVRRRTLNRQQKGGNHGRRKSASTYRQTILSSRHDPKMTERAAHDWVGSLQHIPDVADHAQVRSRIDPACSPAPDCPPVGIDGHHSPQPTGRLVPPLKILPGHPGGHLIAMMPRGSSRRVKAEDGSTTAAPLVVAVDGKANTRATSIARGSTICPTASAPWTQPRRSFWAPSRPGLQEPALLHLWTSRLDVGTERQRLAPSNLSAAVERRFPVAD